MNKFLFILCPPYSGSTVLWKLLQTSPQVSALPKEGQFLDPVKDIMRNKPYDLDNKMPWEEIRKAWEEYWDLNKLVLLEKSPPNLMRAFEIEDYFQKSHFIAMIRNPYASCEGIYRRNNMTLEEAIKFWVKCAEHQIKNIKDLKNITYFTYEELTDNPIRIRNQILSFMPDLENLNIDIVMRVHSIFGRKPRKLENLNRHKIYQLTDHHLSIVNKVLKQHEDIMGFFGYQYIYPSFSRTVKRNIYLSLSETKELANSLGTKANRLRAKLL